MDIYEAAYRVAHDFPGKVPALAKRMNKHPGTLSNEINTNDDGHKLGLGTALAMSIAANDTRIAEAFCWELDGFFVKKPPRTGASDIELLSLWLQREQTGGDFARVVAHCYEDGRISAADWKAIETAGMAYVAAFLELMFRFKGMSDV